MNLRICFFSIVVALLSSSFALADLNFLVLEREGIGGHLIGAGHSAIHFTGICPDDSPVKMRACQPGEAGSVLSRYAGLSPEGYDWVLTPVTQFLYGVDSFDQAPLFGDEKMQDAIQSRSYNKYFSNGIKLESSGVIPDGAWKKTLSQTFTRSIYSFHVKDTSADELKIVDSFNKAANKQKFNLFWQNCTDLPRQVMQMIEPGVGRGPEGLGMTTPKGLAKEIVDVSEKNPDASLTITKFPQLPSTWARSGENLFPLENAYKNPVYLIPTAIGAPYLLVGSFMFHTVIDPFSIPSEYQNYANLELGRLTIEQRSQADQLEKFRLAQEDARVNDQMKDFFAINQQYQAAWSRITEIKKAKETQWNLVFGSNDLWNGYRTQFNQIIQTAKSDLVLPADIKGVLDSNPTSGQLQEKLIGYFHDHGTYTLDQSGNIILSLTMTDDRVRQAGVSRNTILSGDPLLSALIMLARVDYHLSQGSGRRETADEFKADWELLQAAACRLHGSCK